MTTMPKVGEVQEGHVFIGGDPADKNSWTPVPQAALSTPTPGTVENGYRFNGGDPGDKNSWSPVESAPSLSIKNETHPDISWADRAIVKNFSGTPEAALQYLKEKHPNLDIQFRPTLPGKSDPTDIIVKKPGEREYRRLDPQGFDIADLSDIGYDVGAGLLTTLASGAGGVAGGVAGGIGALPSAALAGAGTSAGLEAARQNIGSLFGMKDNRSLGDVAVAGAAGAAAPFLFGTGATSGQVAAKSLEKNLSLDAVKELANSQKGYLSRGLEKLGPFLGSASSGVKKSSFETAKQFPDEVAALGKSPDLIEWGQQNVAPAVETINNAVHDKGAAMEAISSAASEAGVRVPVDSTLKILENAADKLGKQNNEWAQEASKSLWDKYWKIQDNTIPGTGEMLPDNVWAWIKGLEEETTFNANPLKQAGAPRDTVVSKRVEASLKDAAQALKAAMDSKVKPFGKARSELSDMLAVREKFSKMLNVDPNASDIRQQLQSDTVVQNFKKMIQNPEKKNNLKIADKMFGTNLEHKAKVLQSADDLYRKGVFATSSEGTTSTSRTIGAGVAGGAAGYYAGAATGQQGAAGPGALVGAGLGAVLGGPAAMRAAFLPLGRAQRAVVSGAQKAAGGAPVHTFAPSSAWQMLWKNGGE